MVDHYLIDVLEHIVQAYLNTFQVRWLPEDKVDRNFISVDQCVLFSGSFHSPTRRALAMSSLPNHQISVWTLLVQKTDLYEIDIGIEHMDPNDLYDIVCLNFTHDGITVEGSCYTQYSFKNIDDSTLVHIRVDLVLGTLAFALNYEPFQTVVTDVNIRHQWYPSCWVRGKCSVRIMD